jgi:hypothetical protein
MTVAQALLRRALMEIAGAPSRTTRVTGWREVAAEAERISPFLRPR